MAFTYELSKEQTAEGKVSFTPNRRVAYSSGVKADSLQSEVMSSNPGTGWKIA